jgi:hypothetical protein
VHNRMASCHFFRLCRGLSHCVYGLIKSIRDLIYPSRADNVQFRLRLCAHIH